MQCQEMWWFLFVFSIAFLLSNQKQVEGMKRKKDGPPIGLNVAGSSKKQATMKEPHQQMEEREQQVEGTNILNFGGTRDYEVSTINFGNVNDEEKHLVALQYDDQIELRSNIWKIFITGTEEKLFNKLNKEQTECAICTAKKKNKYIIKTSEGSTTNLINHLKSIHKESEECKHFLELERTKKEYTQTMRINKSLEEMKTKRSRSKIWKIYIAGTNQKVFKQLNKDEAECLICKGKEGRRYIYKIKTSNLIKHLKIVHNESEECKQYLELECAKDDKHSSLQIDQLRISVEAHQHHIVVGSSDGASLAKLPRRGQLMQSSSGSSNSPTATSLTIIPDNGIVVFKLHPGLGIWMSKIRIHNHGTGPQKFNVESKNSAMFNIMPEEQTLNPDKHATVDLTFEGDNFESVAGSKFFVKADEAGNENVWTFEARIE